MQPCNQIIKSSNPQILKSSTFIFIVSLGQSTPSSAMPGGTTNSHENAIPTFLHWTPTSLRGTNCSGNGLDKKSINTPAFSLPAIFSRSRDDTCFCFAYPFVVVNASFRHHVSSFIPLTPSPSHPSTPQRTLISVNINISHMRLSLPTHSLMFGEFLTARVFFHVHVFTPNAALCNGFRVSACRSFLHGGWSDEGWW